MTYSHVPVLAGELIDPLEPHPGETAVDGTSAAAGTRGWSQSRSGRGAR